LAIERAIRWSRWFEELTHEAWRSALAHHIWLSIETEQRIGGALAARVPQLQGGIRKCLGGGADLPTLQGDDGLAQRLIGQHGKRRSILCTVRSEGQFLITHHDRAENVKVTRWP
jgi:hypothetical protein